MVITDFSLHTFLVGAANIDTLKDPAIVDQDEKVVGLTDTLGGKQEMWFLTEDGLYEVLMQSRKPIAKGSSVSRYPYLCEKDKS